MKQNLEAKADFNPKDRYFFGSSYQVRYSAKVKQGKEIIGDINDKTDVCFSALLTKIKSSIFQKGTDDGYLIDIDLKIKKLLPDSRQYETNSTMFDKDSIEYYLSMCRYIFDCEDIVLTEEQLDDREYYNIHIRYNNIISNIIVLLTTVRFLYEVPYMNCVYIVFEYIKRNPDKKDYFMYILNTLIAALLRFGRVGSGHTYFSGCIFKKFSNEYFRNAVKENTYCDSGYRFADKFLSSVSTSTTTADYLKASNTLSAFYNKYFHNIGDIVKMINSYFDLTHLTLYDEIEKQINKIFENDD